MTTAPLPPNLVARNDQDQAALADLTRRAHIHRGCTLPDVCAVDDITRHLMDRFLARRTTVRDIARLLAVASLERSRRLTPAQILGLDTAVISPPAAPVLRHDDTITAIADMIERDAPDPRSQALIAVLTIHIAQHAPGPDTECPNCEGAGTYYEPDLELTIHCHCGCAWCVGCDEPVCDGPCETVSALADALHIGARHG